VFNVVSVITTTGFHTGAYDSWGGFGQVAFFVMMFVGGCTGSTAGGIKVFRYEILFAVTGVHIRRLLHPHAVFVIDFNQVRLTDAVVRSVLGFMLLYFFCFVLLALALTVIGLDVTSALSGAASALANVGPGLGHLIGPASSYAELPDEAKCLLAFGMLAGRLELATVLILFSRAFWQE
jgi:trk system potassium uptake protein TrkH